MDIWYSINVCHMRMVCFVLILYIPYDTGMIGRVKQFIKSMYKEAMLWDAKYKAIIVNIILTIIRWLVLSITYYLAFRAFGIEAKWPEVGIIPIISTLIGYIPISVGGIGTVELCAVYLFSLISIDRVYVIDVYIFIRFITYLQAGIILGLCNWHFRRAQPLKRGCPPPTARVMLSRAYRRGSARIWRSLYSIRPPSAIFVHIGDLHAYQDSIIQSDTFDNQPPQGSLAARIALYCKGA